MNPKKNKNMRHRKSGIVHKIGHTSGNYFTSECGVAWGSRGLYESTSDEATCKRCLYNIKKEFLGKEGIRLVAKRAKLDVKIIKTFQTSDSKVFHDEDEAYEHEEELNKMKAELFFDKYVDKLLVESGINVLARIRARRDTLYEFVHTPTSFYRVLWELFNDHKGIVEKSLKKFKELKE